MDDEICGANDKRPCEICEGLAVHPDLDPVPAPRTIEEARAARRQGEEEDHQREMPDLFRRMNIANGHRHQETVSPREALHFQRAKEAMKKRIRKLSAEGQLQPMRRMSVRYRQEFSGVQRGLMTEGLFQAMKAGLKRPNLNATWP